jgi:integrase
MAIVRRKLRNGKVSYWIKFSHNGKDVWEKGGTTERAAKALEAQRKREVAAGTYMRERTGRVTMSGWLADFFAKRTNRTVANDRALIERHVLSLEWFGELAVQEMRPRHLVRLVEDMRAAGRLGEKSISTVMGVVMLAVRTAHVEDLLSDMPVLPRGMLRRKTAPGNKRKPYQRHEVHAILTCPELRPDYRVFAALAFYTGMREGEVCGRRWRDLDAKASPLAALSVHSQYNDQPLKGDERDISRPRAIPVHPELWTILHEWAATGFELVHCRKPTRDDFIVPQASGANHTKSSGYKMFQRILKTAGITNRSLHSTRHAFISIARSCGARADVLERVTHNAAGETIDDYTTFEWQSLCEAVSVLRVDATVDPIANRAALQLQSLDSNQGESGLSPRKLTEGGRRETERGHPGFVGESGVAGASRGARHQLTPAHLAIAFLGVTRRAELRAGGAS